MQPKLRWYAGSKLYAFRFLLVHHCCTTPSWNWKLVPSPTSFEGEKWSGCLTDRGRLLVWSDDPEALRSYSSVGLHAVTACLRCMNTPWLIFSGERGDPNADHCTCTECLWLRCESGCRDSWLSTVWYWFDVLLLTKHHFSVSIFEWAPVPTPVLVSFQRGSQFVWLMIRHWSRNESFEKHQQSLSITRFDLQKIGVANERWSVCSADGCLSKDCGSLWDSLRIIHRNILMWLSWTVLDCGDKSWARLLVKAKSLEEHI